MGYWGDDIPPYAQARLQDLGETLNEAFQVEDDTVPPSITCLMLELSRESLVKPSSPPSQVTRLSVLERMGLAARPWRKPKA